MTYYAQELAVQGADANALAFRAMRQRVGFSQREAAAAAEVPLITLKYFETPQPGRRVRPVHRERILAMLDRWSKAAPANEQPSPARPCFCELCGQEVQL